MLVHDLEAKTVQTLEDCWWGRWLRGDRLLCLEPHGEGSRLTLGRPDEPRQQLRSWPEHLLAAGVSPGLDRVLVQVWNRVDTEKDPEAGCGFWIDDRWWKVGCRLHEVLVFEAATLNWIDLSRRMPAAEDGRRLIPRWAGNDTIALTGRSSFGLLEVAGEEPPSWVFGGP
jgi:hypothetical protein